MKPVETSEMKTEILETMLTDEVNRILNLQYEIAEIKEQLDTAIQSAAKQSYPKGEVVHVEKLLAVKKISEVLSIKLSEKESLVMKLYHSVFPQDIFISQNYFDVWVKIDSNTVVKFDDDLSGIEVKVPGDLN